MNTTPPPCLPRRYPPVALLLLLCLASLGLGSRIFAATVVTDRADYPPGEIAQITGTGWEANEVVTLQVLHADPTHPATGEDHEPWTVTADASGNFTTIWHVCEDDCVGETLLLTATGPTSGTATYTFTDAISKNLDQLQNGTSTHNPEWANGNINNNNSCYSEGDSVPYRYFVSGFGAGSPVSHTFVIQFEYTKAGKRAFDYLTDYNLTEAGPIAAAGGPCGPGGSSVPANCAAPVAVGAFPPIVGFPSYFTGYGGAPLAASRNLYAFNVASVSFSGYTVSGSVAGDSDISITVTFTPAVANQDVGFYWGGHLANGTSTTWGTGNGSGSVSGAPYHMRAINFDNGGAGNQDRSIQNGSICLPPQATITCDAASFCAGSTHTCSAPAGAGSYTWTVTGATFTGQGTPTITLTVTASAGPGAVTVSLMACAAAGTCAGNSCCNTETKSIDVINCCTFTVAVADQTECDDPGATVSANVVGGTGPFSYVWSVSPSGPTVPGNVSSFTDTFLGTHTWTVVVTDNGVVNCSKTDSGTVTILDCRGNGCPIQCPPDVSIACGASTLPANTGSATCFGPGCNSSFTDVVGGGCTGKNITRTWTCSDGLGNSATCVQLITIVDTTAPTISALPGPTTIECPASPSFATPTATDTCDATVTLTFVDSSSGTCPVVHVRTWTATDDCGNTQTASQTINVADTTKPVISTLPAPSTIECPAVPAFATPTATDTCDATVTLTFVDSSSGTCPVVHVRTWTATDDCGNTQTASQTISVADTTKPVISALPGPTTIECPAVPAFATPTATDTCDATVALTFVDSSSGTCPVVHVRTWTATDDCGNTQTASQTISVADTTKPVISALPGPTTIECPAVPAFATPTATDTCDATVTLTFVDSSSGTCPVVHVRTWTATDDCGNTQTASQTISVADTTKPVISALPGPTTIECPAVPAFATPTATDTCDATVTLTFVDSSSGTCPVVHVRTWTATDDCGNTQTASQTISVADTTKPVISTLPAPSTIECPAVPAFATPTATDTCDATVTLTFVDSSSGTCPVVHVRTWTATDDCGNTQTASQTISVADTTKPVISALPGPTTIECPAVPAFATPTATDTCDATVTLTFVDSSSGTCPVVHVRTWTATDDCGNTQTASQTISVADTTKPVISALPGPTTIECPAVPAFATPTATDTCDATVTLTFVDSSSGTCPVVHVRTWTATDDCGNTQTASQTISVADTTKPVISALPGPTTIECPAVPAFATPTATDTCDATVTLTFVDSSSGTCPVVHVRTWTATDDCGNTQTASQTISVADTTKPVISALPGPTTIECPAVPAFATPTATDTCDATVTLTFVDSSSGTCPVVHVRTWTATDDCGNTQTASQTINVADTTKPVISALPAPSTIECPAVPAFATPTATDTCDATVTLTFVDSSSGTCPVVHVRTWTATDDCGNTQTASQTISVADTTKPVISALPGPTTIECPAVPAFATPTATDTCDATVTLTFVDSSSGTCPVVHVRTWTATDDCGNTQTASQTINVADTTKPVISALPAPSTIECPAVPAFATPTASDTCDATVTLTFVDSSSGTCPVVHVRTWTATDDCGNTQTASQTISVADTTKPVISALPAPSTIECPAVPAFATPTATDTCDATVTLTFVDSSSGTCPVVHVRTWTATDDCGNTQTASQTISVADTTKPVISALPGPTTIECPAVPAFATPTATDTCDATVTLTFVDSSSGTCPVVHVRTWTATDDCGNTQTASQTIRVADTTKPVISALPGPTTIECPAVPAFATPTATDTCDATVTLTFVDSSSGTCPVVHVRTWTATDDCGNTQTASQTIRVADTTAPSISALPAPSTVECPASPSFATPTATDACDATVTLTFVDSSSGTCPVVHVRTWTATDDCGNTQTASQTISVADTTKPVISALPGPTTIECPAVPAFATPTATDTCDATVTLTFVDSSSGTCPVVHVRTWTATDDCGNTQTASQTISVADTTKPVISALPGPTTIECPAVPAFATPTATDTCDATVTLTFVDSSSGTCPVVHVRTWTATDDCGNTQTASQTIRVADTTKPVISALPAPSTIECPAVPAFATPTATDTCDATVTLTFVDSSSGTCPVVHVRTWTATDDCGNTQTASQTIRVTDTTKPVITCPKDYYANCGNCSADPAVTGLATATDNCDLAVTITHSDVALGDTTACPWTITRTWRATDDCGNWSECIQTITCVPFSWAIITDSSLCTYDLDLTTTCRDFRLIFSPDTGGYRLTASNPGQTFYNVFYIGTPGATVTFNLKIPYPYVTQGANPLHAYDGVTISGAAPTYCITPGNGVSIISVSPALPITLAQYSPQNLTATRTVTVTLKVPATGFIYLNLHLDYGLKQTLPYGKGGPSGNDAINPSTLAVLIPDRGSYTFSVSGNQTASDAVCNINAFKKNAGIAGQVQNAMGDPVPGATVTLKTSSGVTVGTTLTDLDGFYSINYKHVGKAADYNVFVSGPITYTKTITLKANAFFLVNFP